MKEMIIDAAEFVLDCVREKTFDSAVITTHSGKSYVLTAYDFECFLDETERDFITSYGNSIVYIPFCSIETIEVIKVNRK